MVQAVSCFQEEQFGDKKFSDRIRQEIKRNKYFNHLELKRKRLLEGKIDAKMNEVDANDD